MIDVMNIPDNANSSCRVIFRVLLELKNIMENKQAIEFTTQNVAEIPHIIKRVRVSTMQSGSTTKSPADEYPGLQKHRLVSLGQKNPLPPLQVKFCEQAMIGKSMF